MICPSLQQFRGRQQVNMYRPIQEHQFKNTRMFSPEQMQFGYDVKHAQRNWVEQMLGDPSASGDHELTKWGGG